MGQGGAAIIKLGVVAKNIGFISPSFADILHGVGVFVGLIMWAYAILWIVFAFVTIVSRVPKIKFSVGWWGFTFPLGNCIYHLRTDLTSKRYVFIVFDQSW